MFKPHLIGLDGKGGIADLAKKTKAKSQNVIWCHAAYEDKKVVESLLKDYKLDEDVVEALTAKQTRPRYFTHEQGIVFILRAVNLNKNSRPHDMISIRIWVDKEKIITLAQQEIKAINTVLSALDNNKGPKDTLECLLEIMDALAEDIAEEVSVISDRTDVLETEVINSEKVRDSHLRANISNMRRKIVSIRRYLAPYRDIYIHLKTDNIGILNKDHRDDLREIYNKVAKSVEDLDYARDHLAVSFEELQGKVNVKISKIMYTISIVTVVFMPMNMLTSLLGINVQGIPYADAPYAFEVVVLILLAICLMLAAFFRRIKWI